MDAFSGLWRLHCRKEWWVRSPRGMARGEAGRDVIRGELRERGAAIHTCICTCENYTQTPSSCMRWNPVSALWSPQLRNFRIWCNYVEKDTARKVYLLAESSSPCKNGMPGLVHIFADSLITPTRVHAHLVTSLTDADDRLTTRTSFSIILSWKCPRSRFT